MNNHRSLALFIVLLSLLFSTQAQVCVSHRIIIGEAPDNSLEGLDLAIAQSVAGIEFDVQFTRDGVPVLYHDSKLGEELLGESCPHGKAIRKLDFENINHQCFLTNGESLPLFRHALERLSSFKGHLFIDLKQKASDQFFIEMENSSLLSHPKLKFLSFKKRALRPLRKRWPNTRAILLSRYIPRGFFYDGVGFNKRLRLLAPFFGKIGKETALWTMNSRIDIEVARKKQVDFIITDQYDRCVEQVSGKN